ncbi:AI-2E family transporter [Thermosynechococcus sp. HN-54]|uniref:AI-2E family transporter n=1 Tax=Thermosynechococcus sp. HN-54 TaxID=2933959 RepID=UPI00202CF7FA|nr:AI-2E family transporter [Thermosynechococcus sp. HN-54]URR36159.1 AI-2E family transporter [Thermosynechococcus sp. HN-54]
MFNWLDRLENRRLLRLLLLFALGWVGVQLLQYFAYVLLIFLFAAILAFLLNYPVRWLKRYLPHGFAVTAVFLGTLALLIGLGITLGLAIIGQFQELITSLPSQIDLWIDSLERMEQFLEQWNLEINFQQLESELRNFALAGLQFGFGKLQAIFALFVGGIIVAVITFFMLLEGERLWQYLLSFLPDPWRDRVPQALERNFLGFFSGRLLLSLFFGTGTFIVLLVLRAPYALALAAIAGGFDLVPGIGSTIGISLVCLILLPKGVALSLQVLISCILLQQVEENILMPRVMRNSVNLNPVVLFFALLVGATVAGIVGVFLAIPITGTIVSLWDLKALQAGSGDPPQSSS